MTDTRTKMRIARPKARQLARQRRLVDETFKLFQRTVFPGAAPDQVAALRIAFFAGAQEVYALSLAGMDESEGVTTGDMEFMAGWTEEIERFHEKTIAATSAKSGTAAH